MAAAAFLTGPLAEVQGLYGPYSFAEKILQKLWWRGDFDRAHAVLDDGRRVEILHPGRWNLLGGPDFRDSRLRLGDGAVQVGDVELHLHARDWIAHRHAADPAYDRVILHVVLFPPDPARPTLGSQGQAIPVLTLLPLLHHDLDEFAADEVVESWAGGDREAPEELARMEPASLRTLLRERAAARWQAKVASARVRLQKLGWEGACHTNALEVLGYRFNRAAMLRVAAAFPLAAWQREPAIAGQAWASETGHWSLAGVRPANHPRVRLRQYADWVRRAPAWPDRLRDLAGPLALARGEPDDTTPGVRRREKFPERRETLRQAVCGGQMAGDRFDTLVCDAWLPLLAAPGPSPSAACWEHWYPGDVAAATGRVLRQLGVFAGAARPAAHGPAQGLLGWWLEKETPRLRGGPPA